MSFSYSFRDRPRLSDRIRGKSGDELFKELRKELDQDRKLFFESPSSSPTSNRSTAGPAFSRAGHLFDEPLMRGHTDIRSHLEDLAQRHPEFADQLRYPAWSSDNQTNTNSWGRKRQHDTARNQPQENTGSNQPQEDTTDKTEEAEPVRGRAKDNLRNTVPDMGQKQQQEAEDKESRGQRSWSAPPDNRTQQPDKPRFVSKIEINPVNPDAPKHQTQSGDATKPPMAPPKTQPQSPPQAQSQPQHKQSTVRHIPIFVEGRDEPVLPKNIEPEFVQTPAAPPQYSSRPHPQPPYTSPNQFPHQPTTIPVHFETTHSQPKPQSPPHTQQKQQQQHRQPQQTESVKPEHPPVNPNDPLYRVECVQKEVDELKTKVENVSSKDRSDKEYLLLDELLTRNLIKLDNIETEGKEDVRAARKNAIKSIQRCISVLESRVPAPGGERVGEETMEVEQNQELKVELSSGNDTQTVNTNVQADESHQVNDAKEQNSSEKVLSDDKNQQTNTQLSNENPSSQQSAVEKPMEIDSPQVKEQSPPKGVKKEPSLEKEGNSEPNKESSSNEPQQNISA